MHRFRNMVITVAVIVLAIAGVGVVWYLVSAQQTRDEQIALDPFYTAPDPIPTALGTVIRIAPMDVDVPGGTAQRLLYVSERPDGTRAVSGAMIFIPDKA